MGRQPAVEHVQVTLLILVPSAVGMRRPLAKSPCPVPGLLMADSRWLMARIRPLAALNGGARTPNAPLGPNLHPNPTTAFKAHLHTIMQLSSSSP